eukprot:SAG11_NODE_5681_length_1488_cov_1.167027_1_plen_179_part_00
MQYCFASAVPNRRGVVRCNTVLYRVYLVHKLVATLRSSQSPKFSPTPSASTPTLEESARAASAQARQGPLSAVTCRSRPSSSARRRRTSRSRSATSRRLWSRRRRRQRWIDTRYGTPDLRPVAQPTIAMHRLDLRTLQYLHASSMVPRCGWKCVSRSRSTHWCQWWAVPTSSYYSCSR